MDNNYKHVRCLKLVSCWIVLATLIGILSACSKMDSTYKDFLNDEEFVYPGPADSLEVRPGKNRIGFTWLIIGDPTVTKAVIYWGNGSDSLSVPISQKGIGVDTVTAILANMPEGSYNFTIYTYDDKGNKSIEVNTVGYVYGDKYISSLLDKPMGNAIIQNDTLKIMWGAPADATAINSELIYTDTTGAIRNLYIFPGTDTTLLADYDFNASGGKLQYRTLYVPDSMSIDTFYTSLKTTDVQIELNKTKFKQIILNTDTYLTYDGYPITLMWDNKWGSLNNLFATRPGTGMPQWYTIDMGVTATLSSFKLYHRIQNGTAGGFYAGDPKEVEVWGSNAPASDGSWDSWTLLGNFKCMTPSGADGKPTAEDFQKASIDGENFDFPAGIPAVRYIRFKVVDTWGGTSYMWLSELTFYTRRGLQ